MVNRVLRPFGAAVVACAVVALTPPSRAVLDARPGRDLAAAVPESAGVSSERLRRLDAGMKGLVDQGLFAFGGDWRMPMHSHCDSANAT